MTPYSDPQGLIVQALEQGVPGSVLTQQAPQFADLINRLEAASAVVAWAVVAVP